jgi:hypothetical protein
MKREYELVVVVLKNTSAQRMLRVTVHAACGTSLHCWLCEILSSLASKATNFHRLAWGLEYLLSME